MSFSNTSVKVQLKNIPERGEVVWLDFDPTLGHEQAKRRPALVLSPSIYNGPTGLFVVCPITSQPKGYPYEVLVPSGFPVNGAILSDQVKSLAWKERQSVYICELPDAILEDVFAKLSTLLT